jgi:hypothetical protein
VISHSDAMHLRPSDDAARKIPIALDRGSSVSRHASNRRASTARDSTF